MAHAQKPDFVFRRNGRVHLNRRGCQFSRLLAAVVCPSAFIVGSNAGYTAFRGSVKSTAYPHHSPVSPSLPLPCVTVRHHISTGLYHIHFPLRRRPDSTYNRCVPLLQDTWRFLLCGLFSEFKYSPTFQQDIQYTYKCNAEARVRNQFYRGKAVSVTYYECVFLSFGIQHSMSMRPFVACSMSGCTTYFHIIS